MISSRGAARRIRPIARGRSRPGDGVSWAILDDHLLRDLLADDVPVDLAEVLGEHEPATTNLFLYRLSRSVVSARGGALTGGWPAEHRRALGANLLALPDTIRVVPLATIAYRMAEVADAHRVDARSRMRGRSGTSRCAAVRVEWGRRARHPRSDVRTRARLSDDQPLNPPPRIVRSHDRQRACPREATAQQFQSSDHSSDRHVRFWSDGCKREQGRVGVTRGAGGA